MFQFTGFDIALARNDSNGKWDAKISTSGPNKDNPVFESTCKHNIATTLLSRKRGRPAGSDREQGGYYGDSQNRRGTLLWTIKLDRLSTGSDITAFVTDGMEQMVRRNRMKLYEVTARRASPGYWMAKVDYVLPDGVKDSFSI